MKERREDHHESLLILRYQGFFWSQEQYTCLLYTRIGNTNSSKDFHSYSYLFLSIFLSAKNRFTKFVILRIGTKKEEKKIIALTQKSIQLTSKLQTPSKNAF